VLNIEVVSSIYQGMKDMGMIFIILGVILVLTGVLIFAGGNLSWLGKLPGDIHVERPGFSFSFPITTCILISIVFSLIFYLLKMFR